MNPYEEIIDQCHKENIKIIEKNFLSRSKGLWKNDKIGISKQLTTVAEKRCVLSEEYGHYATSTGNIIDLRNITNLRQEHRARSYAYEQLCSLPQIVHALRNGAQNEFEIAEYLCITDTFLKDAMKYHKGKHGLSYKHGNITIIFEPTFRIYDEEECCELF